jgi:hypothetical protein
MMTPLEKKIMRHGWPLVLSIALHLMLASAVGDRSALQNNSDEPKLAPHRSAVNIVELPLSKPQTGIARIAKVTSGAKPLHKPASAASPVVAQEAALSGEPVAVKADGPSALIEFAVPPDSFYFKTDQLDAKPQVLLDVPPELALTLKANPAESAILRLLINENGDIDDVVIVESSFSGPNQHQVRDALAKMKFNAGRIGEKTVKSEMTIELKLEKIEGR